MIKSAFEASGTRFPSYRCFLPDLAEFTRITSPEASKADHGGERGIRTPGAVKHTRFPIVLLRPLGHLSSIGLSTVGLPTEKKELMSIEKNLAERKGFEPPVR